MKDKLGVSAEGAGCEFCDVEAEALARRLLDIAVEHRNRLVRDGVHPLVANCAVRHATSIVTGHILGYSVHSENRDREEAATLFTQITREIDAVAGAAVAEAEKLHAPKMDLSTYTGPMGSC